jgi:hypothetical protein
MKMSEEAFYARIYRKKSAHQDRDAQFVQACAVETHMDMSQKAFRAEIQRENAGRFRYHLD